MWRVLAFLSALLLAACTDRVGDGMVDVAFIGDETDLFGEGIRIGPGAQMVRAARWQGLVRFDPTGEIVPGIAERWIVTDDGLSYIFRIRENDSVDGESLTAQTAKRDLIRAIAALEGTSFGLDLAKVRDIRAMTGRVIEIRLNSPMPGFLHLLAQPELVITSTGGQAGLMAMSREEDRAVFSPLSPLERGLPDQDDWAASIRPVSLIRVPASTAVAGFANDRFDLVTGGRIQDLPLASGGPLSSGTVRLDSAIGLFGLDVARAEGFLESAVNREALAMALARPALVEPLGLGGWAATARLVPGNISPAPNERWAGLSLDQRRQVAANRVTRWKIEQSAELRLSLRLPEGPGSRILMRELRRQFALIGISLDAARNGEPADLVLRDRVARFAGARWFLNQFHCDVSPQQCSPEADELVRLAIVAGDPAIEAQYLAEAETVLTAQNLYIPLGAPIRWSQVRADVPGFAENPWAFHTLFPMSGAPI